MTIGTVPDAFPEMASVSGKALEVGRLLLKTVLSAPYVDVARVGMREPRYVEINNAISDDVVSHLHLA